MERFITRNAENGTSGSRKRPSDNPETPQTSGKKIRPNDTLLYSNYFSPLMNDNGEATPVTNNKIKTKNPFLPAIILHQELVNPKSTYEKIRSWAKHPVYFKQRGPVRHIHATHKEDFIYIKQQLSALQFKWTSHKSEDDIPKKLILKGIDKSYTEDEVYTDLKKQFNSVIKVKQLTKADEDGKLIPLGVYLVYFEWNTRLSVAMKVIRFCCYHKVNWNHFVPNKKQRKSNNVINVNFLTIIVLNVVWKLVVSNVVISIVLVNVQKLRV